MSLTTRGPGTWFDGANGTPRPVTVALEGDALTIASAQGGPLARWDYAAVERLAAPEHRLRLGLAGSPSTARLEAREPAFAEAVKARLDLRTAQVEKSERRRRHHVVEWSLAAIAAVILIGVFGIPAIAELLLPFIPRSAEVPIGATVHAGLMRSFDEPGPFECGEAGEKEQAGKAVFLKMLGRLEAAADLPVRLQVFAIRTRVINATAFPGGLVHINKGIIDYAESPDELGGIIGHELGHVAHRDGMRSLLHEAGLSYLFGIALGDVIGGGGLIFAGPKILRSRHSRAQETAADAFGAAVMARLGADSHAFSNMFERGSRNAKPSNDMLLMEDHPSNADRVAAIRATPPVANPKPLLTRDEWQALRQVCSRS